MVYPGTPTTGTMTWKEMTCVPVYKVTNEEVADALCSAVMFEKEQHLAHIAANSAPELPADQVDDDSTAGEQQLREYYQYGESEAASDFVGQELQELLHNSKQRNQRNFRNCNALIDDLRCLEPAAVFSEFAMRDMKSSKSVSPADSRRPSFCKEYESESRRMSFASTVEPSSGRSTFETDILSDSEDSDEPILKERTMLITDESFESLFDEFRGRGRSLANLSRISSPLASSSGNTQVCSGPHLTESLPRKTFKQETCNGFCPVTPRVVRDHLSTSNNGTTARAHAPSSRHQSPGINMSRISRRRSSDMSPSSFDTRKVLRQKSADMPSLRQRSATPRSRFNGMRYPLDGRFEQVLRTQHNNDIVRNEMAIHRAQVQRFRDLLYRGSTRASF